jgi:ABC-type polysaccharide/polyol phosphate transport system ATPase subunit
MNSPTVSEPRVGDPMIQIEHVGVRYRVPHERIGTFKEYAIRWLQRRNDHSEFWALRDVTLQVYRGEVLGVVGRNGAGKSTLLKVISRVLHPTRGRIRVRGCVAPLLELGAGFHPELTGRENVFLNGTLLGRSHREITQRFADVLEFAELSEFIDAPLRMYSSGMTARLGFAVATTWKPDVLLLDEILAVGDEAFQAKCRERIASFRESGTTILLVTHDLNLVQMLCQRTVWIDHGTVQCVGPSGDVARAYLRA